jgi:hypothetical protein
MKDKLRQGEDTMTKYIEFGIGNKSIINTEIELNDGSEYRVKGIAKFDKIIAVYVRIWIGYHVFSIDSKGFHIRKKDKYKIKVLFGIQAE